MILFIEDIIKKLAGTHSFEDQINKLKEKNK